MSKRKQKIILEGFTFTIGKLVIEQEAEDFDGDKLSNNVRNAIGQVISAPSRLLNAESTDTPSLPRLLPTSEEPTKPKRRRRKISASTSNDLASESNGERSSRSKPNSGKSLIEEMKNDGFFAQDRSISEVREELHTRGHSFKSNELSPVLLSMTKQKSLSRRKDESGGWVYYAV